MNNELKPCPFCGGVSLGDYKVFNEAHCNNCHAVAPRSNWNVRTNRWAAFSNSELESIYYFMSDYTAMDPYSYEIAVEIKQRRNASPDL